MTNSSPPEPVLTTAIFAPSGDQPGSTSGEGSVVNRVAWEPSAFMTRMSGFPPSALAMTNAILEPSGDQAGAPGPLPGGSWKITERWEPSARITSMRWPFSSCRSKAILPPSGDQAGVCAYPGRSAKRPRPEPSALTTYSSIVAWSRGPFPNRVKTICDPSGDQAGSQSWLQPGGAQVSRTRPEPSASITNRPSPAPPSFGRAAKTIFDPSGDHAGVAVPSQSGSGQSATFRRPEPSGCTW